MAHGRKVTGRERVISAVILLALAGVVAGVLVKQSVYDASRYAVPDADTQAAETGEAFPFAFAQPDSLVPLGAAEMFVPDTLYEKINGGADRYLDSGFVRLDYQRYGLADDPDQWLALWVYDMGTPANGLAAFTAHRPAGVESIEFAERAYESGGSVFFKHGQYYVRVVVAAESEALAAAAMELARQFEQGMTVELDAAAERIELLFSSEGRVGEIELEKANVFGFDKLDHVYLTHYEIDGVSVTAFLSPRADATEAADLAEAYIAFLKSIGATESDLGGQQPSGVTELTLYEYNYLLFQKGAFFGGVNECFDRGAAQQVGYQLYQAVSEMDE